MDKKETNRAKHIPIGQKYLKGVKLIDVDTTIAEYMENTVIPKLDERGNDLKVPLIYGNAERWEGARKQGYLRDQRGRLQIPLIMFKRNSVEKDTNLQYFREENMMQLYRKYSSKNRYEKFSIQNGVNPVIEMYSVVVPSYVTITYEVMIWTSFTEHMNKIVEAFQYASNKYWGNDNGFRFRTIIESFDNQQELSEGSERIIRTTFNMVVNAYLLPERYNEKPIISKTRTAKRVVWGVETEYIEPNNITSATYNIYAQMLDFLAINNSQVATFINSSTVKIVNVKKPLLPSELVGSFDILNWFRVYINNQFISNYKYTYLYNETLNEISFNFDESVVIQSSDSVIITGKFENF